MWINPNVFPFVLHVQLQGVKTMMEEQSGNSSLTYIKGLEEIQVVLGIIDIG